MKFVADENIDKPIVDVLRDADYDVLYIAETHPNASDTQILNFANNESAILLTADKDFGELVFRQKRVTYGILLIRLSGLSPSHKAKIVASEINTHNKDLPGNFTVISHKTVRIRKTT